MVEPPPVVVEPVVGPVPEFTLRTAYGTTFILVAFLFVLSNIIAIPFIMVGVIDNMVTPMMTKPVANLPVNRDLSQRDLAKLQDGLTSELGTADVTIETTKAQTTVKIRPKSGAMDLTKYQVAVDKVLSEAKIDPGRVGIVRPGVNIPDPNDLMKDPIILVGSLLSIQLSVLVLWLVGRRVYFKGVNAWPPWTTESWVKPVLVGLALGLPVAFSAYYMDSFLRTVVHASNTSMWDVAANFPLWAKAGIVVTGVIGAPVLEEIFFRGMIIGLFQRAGRPWIGAVVSSVLFGIAHLSDVPTVLTIGAMGFVLAAVYIKTKSLYASMIVHAVNNAISFWILFHPN